MQNDPRTEPGKQRAAIDAGLTGDKVPVGDPAAAPMHTDAESAGTPTPAAEAEADIRRQRGIARDAGADALPTMAGDDPAARASHGPRVTMLGVIVAAAAVLVGILLGLA